MRKTTETGMTLPEIMITVAIFLSVSSILYIAFIQATNYYSQGQRKSAVIQGARGALEIMSRSLTEARYFSQVASNAVTFIQFDYDTNNDASDDTVQFYLETVAGNVRLRKNVNSALQRYITDVDENVTALTFEYYSADPTLDTNGDGLASAAEIDTGGNGNGVLDGTELSNVNYVKINLTLAKTQGGGTSSTSLSTSVYLRNLR